MGLDPTIKIVIIVAAVIAGICLAILATALCGGGFSFLWAAIRQDHSKIQRVPLSGGYGAQKLPVPPWAQGGPHGAFGGDMEAGPGAGANDMTGLGGGPPAAAVPGGIGHGASNMTGLGGTGGAWGGSGRGAGSAAASRHGSRSGMSATIQSENFRGASRGGSWAWPGRGRGGSRAGSTRSSAGMSAVDGPSGLGSSHSARGARRSGRRSRRGEDGFEMESLGPAASFVH